jgi:hypothetical protein
VTEFELRGYHDFAVVARGRSSTVYRAQQDGVNRPVAVKVLRRDGYDVETAVRLGRQHPHIVTVIDTGTTEAGEPYVVTDYYDRGSLHDRLLGGGPLHAGEVLAAGIVVSDALAYAHEQGVLHGDVKPQNILVLPTSYVVADFGFAHGVDPADAEWFSLRLAAVQVLDGEPPTAADDVFSLGATLFTLLDGRPPFAWEDADDPLDYGRRIRAGMRRPLRGTDVPAGLVAVVDRCLQRERADRFREAAALHGALAELADQMRAAARDGGPPAPAEPSASKTVDDPTPADLARLVASTAARRRIGLEARPPDRVPPPTPDDEPTQRRPRPWRGRRILVNCLVAVVLGAAFGLGGAWVAGRYQKSGAQAAVEVSIDPGATGSSLNDPRIAPVITGLDVTDLGVVLRWQDGTASEAAFIVFRIVDGTGTPVRTLPPGTTEVTIVDLDPAVPPYCFMVIAVIGQSRGISPTRCSE